MPDRKECFEESKSILLYEELSFPLHPLPIRLKGRSL